MQYQQFDNWSYFIPQHVYYYDIYPISIDIEPKSPDQSKQKQQTQTPKHYNSKQIKTIKTIKTIKIRLVQQQDSFNLKRKTKNIRHKKLSKQIKDKNQDLSIRQSRNTISNILRSFLKFLTKQQAKLALQKINLKYRTTFSITSLYQLLQTNHLDYRNYVRIQTVKKMLLNLNTDKLRIFMLLFSQYHRHYIHNHFLSSTRLKSGSKKLTMIKIREVCQIVYSCYSKAQENNQHTINN